MSLDLPAALADHALLVSAGLLGAALLAVPARALLRRDPVTCYRLLFALLIGAVAVVPLQWLVAGRAAPLAAPLHDWLQLRERTGAPRTRAEPRGAEPSDASASGIYLVDSELRPRRDARGGESDALPLATPDPTRSSAAPIELAAAGVAPSAGGLHLREERPAAFDAIAAALGRGIDALVARRAELASAALLLWLAGVAAVAARRLMRVARTLRLIGRARDVEDAEVLALWRRVVRGSRVAERVRLVESDAVASPACAGLVRRFVILPARRRTPPGVLEWALRHELVHLERGDQWAALFQSAVTALLWFHPAAWWLSSEIGRWRELSCDQQVVEGSGRRRSYALALLEYAACASKNFPAIDADPHSAGVRHALLHWSRSPSQIRRRIEMLTVDPASLPRARRWLGALVATGAFALPALAQVTGAATLLPPRPAQDTPRPSSQVPPPAPPAPAIPSVATPTSLPVPAVAPPRAIDDPATPVPRARRHVTVPSALATPRVATDPAPQSVPTPTLAPPPVRPAASNRVDGDDDEDEIDEIEAVDAAPARTQDGDDAAGQRVASAVQQELAAAHREIERAVRQAQRSSESRQRDVERELARAAQQADSETRQGAQKREALERKLAGADDDDRKAKLESELATLEDANRSRERKNEEHCVALKKELAALDDVNFDGCRESLDALKMATDLDARELQRAVATGLAAQRQELAALKQQGQLAQDGEGGGDGHGEGNGKAKVDARKIREAVERALAESRAATDRACARAAEAVAHARERGALDEATQEQIERALVQARKVDVDAIHAQVERALAQAQVGMKRAHDDAHRLPADPAITPRGRGEAATAADPLAPRTPAPPQAPQPRRPGSARAGAPPAPTDVAPEDPAPRAGRRGGGGDRAAEMQDRIEVLEAQIEKLRAELDELRRQQPAPSGAPPARRRVAQG